MLQVVRFANFFFGHSDVSAVVGLGRAVAAVFGALTVGATVLLARRIVGEWMALAAGILAAVTPLLTFHAQLFKEDVFVAPWLLLAITALDRLRERPGIGRAATFGVLTGLAAASKYIGVIVLPLACLAPGRVGQRLTHALLRQSRPRSRRRTRHVYLYQRAGVGRAKYPGKGTEH